MTNGLRRAGMIDMEPNTTLVQQFPAHEAVPDGAGPFPAVLVLHDAVGLTVAVRGFANRLGREGFFALAPNLFAHPFSLAAGAPAWMSYPVSGADATSEDPAERAAAALEESKAQVENLSRTRVREILDRALGYLALAADADASRAALLGFGIGGRAAFRGACELGHRIRAVVVYSGIGIAAPYPMRPVETMPILEFEGLRAPSLFFYGSQDPEIRAEEREMVARVLSSTSWPHEIVSFREAGHAFYEPDGPDHRISATRDAWGKTLAFLRENLAGKRADAG